MPNLNKKFTINFNVQLDPPTDDMLVRLASDKSLSKAHVVRTCIRNSHRMTYQRTPLCADGQTCRCPHAHIYAPSQPPPNPDQDTDALDRP